MDMAARLWGLRAWFWKERDRYSYRPLSVAINLELQTRAEDALAWSGICRGGPTEESLCS